MDKLRLLAKRLSDVNVETKLLDIIATNEGAITDLNKDQLQDSIDADGVPLEEYKSIAYANRKGRITVDLKLTGAFYESFFLVKEKFPVLFGASDSKTFSLKERYGDEILGLTKRSKAIANKTIFLPEIQTWLKRVIKL